MPAPTIPDLPALPTFPSGPGLPDQPGVFIPQFLAFLEALNPWADALAELAAFVESSGTGGGGSGGGVEGFQWSVSNTAADSHTVSSDDIFRHLRFTNDVAAELLVPLAGSHDFEIGDCMRITQLGDGQVVITAATPAIIFNTLDGNLTTAGPGAVVELTYVGSDEWDAFGDLDSNGILLSGDMTDGDDQLLLSGDMTDGDDIEIASGV